MILGVMCTALLVREYEEAKSRKGRGVERPVRKPN
jgi:hypothetical protein